MRLRLWWHLCVLESRASEDQGFLPSIDVTNKGRRLPLNVNDDQIYPSMVKLPIESDSWTEMSFSLIQIDGCRLLHPVLDTSEQHPVDIIREISEKRAFIQKRRQYLLSRISERTGPLSHLAVQHGITACRKMEFILQLREEIAMQIQQGDDKNAGVYKPSFQLACDSLESSRILLNGDVQQGFKWFFTVYTPWYAMVYVLRCLQTNPCGSEADRAWNLIEELFPHADSLHTGREGTNNEFGHGSIWKHLIMLRDKIILLRQSNQYCTVNTETEEQSIDADKTTGAREEKLPTPSCFAQRSTRDISPDVSSALHLSTLETSFIPDWNAIINGCLNEYLHNADQIYSID